MGGGEREMGRGRDLGRKGQKEEEKQDRKRTREEEGREQVGREKSNKLILKAWQIPLLSCASSKSSTQHACNDIHLKNYSPGNGGECGNRVCG